MFRIENESEKDYLINRSDVMEFDWIGIDKLGQLAVFSTYGKGYMPEKIFKNIPLFNEFVEYIENLQEFTIGELITKKIARWDDWEEYSKKGFFAYEIEDTYRTDNLNKYFLVYKPNVSIKNIQILEKFEVIIPKFNIEFCESILFEDLINNLTN